jgi:hypothetical protein
MLQAALVNPRRDSRISEVAIVTTIQMAVLWLSGAQDDRCVTTPVVGFPLATARITSAVPPS